MRDVAVPGVKRFVCEYDFGDGWEHDIAVGSVAPYGPGWIARTSEAIRGSWGIRPAPRSS